MGLTKSVQSDDLTALIAVRDAIASDLDACDSFRDRASLYMRLTDVLARIQELRPRESTGDDVDEIAARRAARRKSGAATGSSRAKRSG